MFGTSEEEFIEQSLCLEKLIDKGIDDKYSEFYILNCTICPMAGRCDVDSSKFLGASTC